MITENNYQTVKELTSNFYIKHNNNIKLLCRETPKGISVLGTYSCKTLFSRNDTSQKTVTRTFSNNDEFIEMIQNMEMDIKNIAEDKKYIVVAGITKTSFVWLKYYCCVEYLVCHKFDNALFLESSVIAAGKEFAPHKLDINKIVESKKINLRISAELIKIIDKRNIFFRF